jgi:hypothetical protein
VAHVCNHSYPGGRDQEDRGLKPAQGNSLLGPISKNTQQKKGLDFFCFGGLDSSFTASQVAGFTGMLHHTQQAFFFFFGSVQGLELRALHLVGKHATM